MTFDAVDFVVTTPANNLVITLGDAKLHLRVDDDSEDDLITALIQSATKSAEHHTGLKLLRETAYTLMGLFYDEVRFFRNPVYQISSITYYDKNNALQTLSTSHYYSQVVNGVYTIRFHETPETYNRMDCVKITFTCGFATANEVPQDIKSAIKLMIGHLYENRQGVLVGTITSELPIGIKYLLDQNRYQL